jgi:hypothetical protein
MLTMMQSFTACNESYFDNDPIGSFDEQSYWKSESDVKSWIAGTYNGVLQTLGDNYILWGEARSDNFYPNIYGGSTWQYELLQPTNGACSWNELYSVINRCNMGLENIDRVSGITEANKNNYRGQMYAIRAWMYYYAIRVWGDVPMITQTWDGGEDTRYNARTAVEIIHSEVIEKDLANAVELLPKGSNCFCFNKAGALALRTDVDLWFGNYQRVIDDSQTIKDMATYALATNITEWRNIFLTPETSKESIFTLHWDLTNNGANPYGAQLGGDGKNPMVYVSNAEFDIMLRDKKDVRFWGVLDTMEIFNASGSMGGSNKTPITTAAIVYNIGTATCGIRVMKFNQLDVNTYKFTTVTAATNAYKLPIYRYADVLLNRALALNKRNESGDAQEAIDIVNAIRIRCGNTVVAQLADYPVKDGYGADSRERLILDERQVEFYGEGKRWFDLRRAGDEILYAAMNPHLKTIQMVHGFPLEGFLPDGRKLFPLHKNVFSSNPKLVGQQNPPYSE